MTSKTWRGACQSFIRYGNHERNLPEVIWKWSSRQFMAPRSVLIIAAITCVAISVSEHVIIWLDYAMWVVCMRPVTVACRGFLAVR